MRADEKGAALVSLIVLIMVFGALGAATVQQLSQGSAAGVIELNRARAFYLAESGISDSFWELKYSEKLYGAAGEEYGLISPRTVSFEGSVTGIYSALEEDNVIQSSGSTGGVARELMQRIESGGRSYTLYRADSGGDLELSRGVEVTGNIFTNSSLTVSNRASVDTTEVDLFLPEGETASYANGDIFPYENLGQAPNPPSLNISWYDSLLSEAAAASGGTEIWGSENLEELELINGNLVILPLSVITTAHDTTLVAVDGSVIVMPWVILGDNIKVIAAGGINIISRAQLGNTEGRSGNLLFARDGSIEIGNSVEVNGVILANSSCTISRAEVNGLLWADAIEIGRDTEIRGALWANIINGNELGRDSKVLDYAGYIPANLPRGISVNWGSGAIELAANGWRELN